MPTPNHNLNTPEKGSLDWDVPLNENFSNLDAMVTVRRPEAELNNHLPYDYAKFEATDTRRVYIGMGGSWTLLGIIPTHEQLGLTPPSNGGAYDGVPSHYGVGKGDPGIGSDPDGAPQGTPTISVFDGQSLNSAFGNVGSGDHLYIGPGTYEITSFIRLSNASDVVIEADPDAHIILNETDANNLERRILNLVGCPRLEWYGGVWDGDMLNNPVDHRTDGSDKPGNQFIAAILDCPDLNIHGVTFQNAREAFLSIGANGGQTTAGTKIHHNDFHLSGERGIYFTWRASDCEIYNNNMEMVARGCLRANRGGVNMHSHDNYFTTYNGQDNPFNDGGLNEVGQSMIYLLENGANDWLIENDVGVMAWSDRSHTLDRPYAFFRGDGFQDLTFRNNLCIDDPSNGAQPLLYEAGMGSETYYQSGRWNVHDNTLDGIRNRMQIRGQGESGPAQPI